MTQRAIVAQIEPKPDTPGKVYKSAADAEQRINGMLEQGWELAQVHPMSEIGEAVTALLIFERTE